MIQERLNYLPQQENIQGILKASLLLILLSSFSQILYAHIHSSTSMGFEHTRLQQNQLLSETCESYGHLDPGGWEREGM